MAEAGDAAGLRAYGIRVFYTGAQALDRYRHRAIIAIRPAPGKRPPHSRNPPPSPPNPPPAAPGAGAQMSQKAYLLR